MPAAVSEGHIRELAAERAHRGFVGNAAKGNNRAELCHLRNCRSQKVAACSYFRRRRLVLGRHAAHRIGDPTVYEFQSIVGMRPVIAAGKTELEQRLVEQDAGVIAGERAAGTICTLQPGRKTDDQYACIDRSKGGHWRIKPGWLSGAPGLAEFNKPWASRTVAPRLSIGPGHCA